jgi:hypothetical protein
MKRFALAILLALVPSLAWGQVVNWGHFVDSNQTIYLYFNTVGTDGVAETIAGEDANTVEIYEDGSATQITDAETLDDDFDSTTGYHQLAVDLNNAAFEDGKVYTAVLKGGTVDSVSIAGRVIGVFRVGTPAANVTQVDGAALDTHDAGAFPADLVEIANAAVSTSAAQLGVNVVQIGGDTQTATDLKDFADAGYDPSDNSVVNVQQTGTTLAIDTGGITAASIASNAITAAEIAVGAIEADAFAAGAIDAAAIADDAIGASELATAAIADAELNVTGSEFTALPWNAAWDTEVQSEVQDAIEANHLDHLLAATYDPASKPGAADALLNELVESDAGVARYTANALEQGPSGSGGSSASAIADAVWDETRSDHVAAGSFGAAHAGVKDEPQYNENGGRIWYVDDDDGSGDTGTYAAPFDTIAAGISAASNGDTVIVRAGSYTAGGTVNKSIHLRGERTTTTQVTLDSVNQVISVTAGGAKVSNLFITNTNTATGDGIKVQGSLYNVTIKNCDFDTASGSTGSCIDAASTVGTKIIGCVPASAPGATIDVSSASGFLIQGCSIESGIASDTTTDCTGIKADLGAVGVIRDCVIQVTRSTNATADTFGIVAGYDSSNSDKSGVEIRNCRVKVNVTHASATGGAYGIAGNLDRDDPCLFTMHGGGIQVSHARAESDDYEIYASVSGSKAVVSGVNTSYSLWAGPSNVRREEFLASNDSGYVDRVTLTDTATALTEDIALGGAVTATNVDEDHTWRFDDPTQTTAPNDVTEITGSAAVLAAMDFDEPMPAGSSISTISSVTIADVGGATEPTVTSSTIHTAKRKVVINFDTTSATAGTYTVSVKILTTDSQTFTRKGRLVLNAN